MITYRFNQPHVYTIIFYFFSLYFILFIYRYIVRWTVLWSFTDDINWVFNEDVKYKIIVFYRLGHKTDRRHDNDYYLYIRLLLYWYCAIYYFNIDVDFES